jgi:hypothetical protein
METERKRKAAKTLEIALYHRLGDLPEPEFTRIFF